MFENAATPTDTERRVLVRLFLLGLFSQVMATPLYEAMSGRKPSLIDFDFFLGLALGILIFWIWQRARLVWRNLTRSGKGD